MHGIRSIEAIIEEQVRRWQLEQQRRRAEERRVETSITISRQYGARGAELARMVAERLGFQCWDQELVHEMASHARVPDTLMASLDEQRATLIREAIAFFSSGKIVTPGDYRRELMRVIHSLGAHGRAVIVGRGAHYVLDPATTLRIRVVCPLPLRVAGVAERRGISQADARAELERVDAERIAFMRDNYGRDITEATDFDLLINTGTLTLAQAADVVVAAHRSRFGDVATP